MLMIKDATLTGNQIIDNKHKHTFFIKASQNYCNMPLFETTTGLFINTHAPNEQLKFVDRTNSKENSEKLIMSEAGERAYEIFKSIKILEKKDCNYIYILKVLISHFEHYEM
jgi:hypothetical protein